ncbi:MAG: hypothetical protein ACK5LJ_03685 [Paracoccus sp. (in: a-proteobacteria)]
MSHESDSFIDEVTEEVRRDRLFGLFRRYGWIGILLIVVIVGGAAMREYLSSKRQAEAEIWGDAVLAAQQADDPVAALAAIDPGKNADRDALGDLLVAGAMIDAGRNAEAAPRLESASLLADDPVLRDLALLKAVLDAEDMDSAIRDAALSELSKPGAPFRLLALEQKAVALVDAGRDADALTLVREILNEDGVSQGMRARLNGMIIALGADPQTGTGPGVAAVSMATQDNGAGAAGASAAPAAAQ